jgi:predicted  nucleic acid-binding Zn-ribbon protein
MGVTMDRLVETADYYAKILDKERDHFVKAAGEQSVNLIEKRKQELQLLLKGMGDKKKQIEQLQQELLSGEDKIKTIQESIDGAALKIESTKQKFESSFRFLKDQITADIERIKTFLK